MKPKNVVLLGFINRAVDYLDEHMNDEANAQDDVNKSELLFLRQQLGGNLETILGTKQSTVSALLTAGNEAFDHFISGKNSDYSLSQQIDQMLDEPNNNFLSRPTKQQLSKYLAKYNLEKDYDDTAYFSSDDSYMKQIRNNAINDNYRPEEKLNIPSEEGLDQVLNEIIENETKKSLKDNERFKYLVSELKKEINSDNKPVKNININKEVDNSINENKDIDKKRNNKNKPANSSYVNNLIGDFKKKLEVEEENKKVEVLKRIAKIYTYLPTDFIESVYELKSSLASDYPFNRKIIILHRVKFTDVENLRQFVEIGLNHGYTINADEKKMIVDIFKEHMNADGKILTNIYEISNQSFLLNGIYEGYNVIVLDE